MMEKYYEIRLSSAGIAVGMLLLGAVLIIFPEMSGMIFTRGLATAVLLYAFVNAWKGLRARKHEMGGKGYLFGAAVLLVLSGIGFFKPEIILSFLPFVTGALLVLDGIVKVPLIKGMWEWGNELRWSGILSAGIPLLLGFFLASYPFHAAAVVIRVFGIFLFLDGISDVIRSVLVRKKVKL